MTTLWYNYNCRANEVFLFSRSPFYPALPKKGIAVIMHGRLITPIYVINMTIQAIVSLVTPMGLMFLFAWLLDKYTAVGPWIYVVFIILGVFLGLYSMISFIIKTGRAIEALEKQHAEARQRLTDSDNNDNNEANNE